jgi:hypothetical protein
VWYLVLLGFAAAPPDQEGDVNASSIICARIKSISFITLAVDLAEPRKVKALASVAPVLVLEL